VAVFRIASAAESVPFGFRRSLILTGQEALAEFAMVPDAKPNRLGALYEHLGDKVVGRDNLAQRSGYLSAESLSHSQ
jgi:hypothetical protein